MVLSICEKFHLLISELDCQPSIKLNRKRPQCRQPVPGWVQHCSSSGWDWEHPEDHNPGWDESISLGALCGPTSSLLEVQRLQGVS